MKNIHITLGRSYKSGLINISATTNKFSVDQSKFGNEVGVDIKIPECSGLVFEDIEDIKNLIKGLHRFNYLIPMIESIMDDNNCFLSPLELEKLNRCFK